MFLTEAMFLWLLFQVVGAISMREAAGLWLEFGGIGSCAVAVSVAMAESSLSCVATNTNVHKDGTRSYDWGLYQVNTRAWSPEPSCAFDCECNTKLAYKISKKGTNWTPWVTYKRGMHEKYLDRASDACFAALDDLTP